MSHSDLLSLAENKTRRKHLLLGEKIK